MPNAALAFSALDSPCALTVNQPSGLQHYATLLEMAQAFAEAEGEEAPATAADAQKALCGDEGCTAFKAVPWLGVSFIHLVIPDDKGGGAAIPDIGWIGGASSLQPRRALDHPGR